MVGISVPLKLELGALYAIEGQFPRPYPLPPQYFRPESITFADGSGSRVAIGTMWVVLWVGGKRKVVRETNHPLPLHQVQLDFSTGKHDLHFRKVEDLSRELGKGKLYADVLRQIDLDEGRKQVVR